MNACLPTVSVNIDVPCLQLARRNLEAILRLPRATTVVIGLTWELPPSGLRRLPRATGARGSRFPRWSPGLDDLIGRIEASGRRVILIGPIAIPGFDVASYLSRQRAFARPVTHPEKTPSAAFVRQYRVCRRAFRGAARRAPGAAGQSLVRCRVLLFRSRRQIAVRRQQPSRPWQSCRGSAACSSRRSRLATAAAAILADGAGAAALLEHDLVDIAPHPVLARLDRTHDRVLAAVKVFGRVLVARVIAAPDVAARQAHAQVHPRRRRSSGIPRSHRRWASHHGWRRDGCRLPPFTPPS